MTKTLVIILFLVGFFGGLASGFIWANALGFRNLDAQITTLQADVTALKTTEAAEEDATSVCLKEILGETRYEQIITGFDELTADEQVVALPCYAE